MEADDVDNDDATAMRLVKHEQIDAHRTKNWNKIESNFIVGNLYDIIYVRITLYWNNILIHGR